MQSLLNLLNRLQDNVSVREKVKYIITIYKADIRFNKKEIRQKDDKDRKIDTKSFLVARWCMYSINYIHFLKGHLDVTG